MMDGIRPFGDFREGLDDWLQKTVQRTKIMLHYQGAVGRGVVARVRKAGSYAEG